MDGHELVDKRLTDVEMKLMQTDDLVERLNEIVIDQQKRIDSLIREVSRLVQERSVGDGEGVTRRSLLDEVPPHY